jgi:hypothetical protein
MSCPRDPDVPKFTNRRFPLESDRCPCFRLDINEEKTAGFLVTFTEEAFDLEFSNAFHARR